MDKEQQKQLITEIMDLDAKDGLYEHSVSPTYTGEYPFPPKDGYDTVNDTVNDVEKLAKERTDAFVSNYNTYKEIRQFAHAKGFIDGFNKAKQTLYTEEQVWQAAFDAYVKANNESYELTPSDIIKSLKQPK